MSLNCPCGGRFQRTDIEGRFDPKYNRVMYSDLDPLKANWKCNRCGATRTQKKRQAGIKSKDPLESLIIRNTTDIQSLVNRHPTRESLANRPALAERMREISRKAAEVISAIEQA